MDRVQAVVQLVTVQSSFCRATADPGPLARAEHIIYLSTFFNAEAKAILYYKEVEESYRDAAGGVESAEDAPAVVWLDAHANGSESSIMTEDGLPLGEGPAIRLSFARYKVLLTRDAGGMIISQAGALNGTGSYPEGDDVIFAASEYPTEEEMFTDLHASLEGVDVLIDESFLFTTSVRRKDWLRCRYVLQYDAESNILAAAALCLFFTD